MRPAIRLHQDLSSLMILMFFLTLLTHAQRLLGLLDRQIHLNFHQDCPQLLHLLVGQKARAENVWRERARQRSQSLEPQLKPIPMRERQRHETKSVPMHQRQRRKRKGSTQKRQHATASKAKKPHMTQGYCTDQTSSRNTTLQGQVQIN